MKSHHAILIGLTVLGLCILSSVIILCNCATHVSNLILENQSNFISASVTLRDSAGYSTEDQYTDEYINASYVGVMLGYHDPYEGYNMFLADLKAGKLKELPFIWVNDQPIFSRSEFDNWLRESAVNHSNETK